MSTKGYGVFRNTFAPGHYAFNGAEMLDKNYDDGFKLMGFTSQLTHNENRFDAFPLGHSSLKDLLNDYTDITGKPFYAGDVDAYDGRCHLL